MDLWLPGYLAHKKRNPSRDRTTHILLAVCDHYEPWHQATRGQEEALQRLSRWQDAYPKVQSVARDSDGFPPVHTFFFPVEQYDDLVVAKLGKLCSSGAGEVEIHLHHDGDTALTCAINLLEAGTIWLNMVFFPLDQKGSRTALSMATGPYATHIQKAGSVG